MKNIFKRILCVVLSIVIVASFSMAILAANTEISDHNHSHCDVYSERGKSDPQYECPICREYCWSSLGQPGNGMPETECPNCKQTGWMWQQWFICTNCGEYSEVQHCSYCGYVG